MAEKLIVFDLDGTLLDTLEDIRGAINYALAAWSVPKVDKNKIREYVGHGLRNALFTALNKSGVLIPQEDLPLMVDLMLSCYRNHPSDHTRPYDGIVDMLSFLMDDGFKLGVISNKSQELVVRIIKDTLPSIRFEFIIGQCDQYPLKPDPESLLSMMERFSSDRNSTLFVGDSEVDYETAKNAGVRGIIVNYGFRTKKELEGKGIKDTVEDVPTLLERILAFYK